MPDGRKVRTDLVGLPGDQVHPQKRGPPHVSQVFPCRMPLRGGRRMSGRLPGCTSSLPAGRLPRVHRGIRKRYVFGTNLVTARPFFRINLHFVRPSIFLQPAVYPLPPVDSSGNQA